MKVYLIRHAESVGNIKGSLTSTTDFELTEKGKLQAKRVGNLLYEELKGKQVAAYCSPLLRAKQTLEEILCCIGENNIKITQTDDLKEMDLGILEGMPYDEQLKKYPDIDWGKRLSVFHAPEGECYQDVKNRVQRFWNNCFSQFYEGENILIVSHGITLRVLTNLLLNRPDEDVNFLNWMENTARTVLAYDEEKCTFFIERLNDYAHLQELKTSNYQEWGLFAEQDAYIYKCNSGCVALGE
ncbi:MAG: histidine phosphatase family protein [Eubacteriales bacterium]|nr:histidine phosphatase family protein [Eubacteriales bacterium]